MGLLEVKDKNTKTINVWEHSKLLELVYILAIILKFVWGIVILQLLVNQNITSSSNRESIQQDYGKFRSVVT